MCRRRCTQVACAAGVAGHSRCRPRWRFGLSCRTKGPYQEHLTSVRRLQCGSQQPLSSVATLGTWRQYSGQHLCGCCLHKWLGTMFQIAACDVS